MARPREYHVEFRRPSTIKWEHVTSWRKLQHAQMYLGGFGDDYNDECFDRKNFRCIHKGLVVWPKDKRDDGTKLPTKVYEALEAFIDNAFLSSSTGIGSALASPLLGVVEAGTAWVPLGQSEDRWVRYLRQVSNYLACGTADALGITITGAQLDAALRQLVQPILAKLKQEK